MLELRNEFHTLNPLLYPCPSEMGMVGLHTYMSDTERHRVTLTEMSYGIGGSLAGSQVATLSLAATWLIGSAVVHSGDELSAPFNTYAEDPHSCNWHS